MSEFNGYDDNATLLDTKVPNIARIYDWWLGGKDHFPADREAGEKLLDIYPSAADLAHENRAWQERAVTWAANAGIRRFLDIGAGLPTAPNTHETARAINPDAKVCYIDNDPVVVTHAKALLAKGKGVTAATGDLADPEAILALPEVTAVLDEDEPTCVVLASVLHFLPADRATAVVRILMDAMPPGSALVLSCGTSRDEKLAAEFTAAYTAGDLYSHLPEVIASWFRGLHIVDPPGLADARTWRAGMPARKLPPRRPAFILAGAAIKPRTSGR
jgi:SAM-dependent methyltransferase